MLMMQWGAGEPDEADRYAEAERQIAESKAHLAEHWGSAVACVRRHFEAWRAEGIHFLTADALTAAMAMKFRTAHGRHPDSVELFTLREASEFLWAADRNAADAANPGRVA